MKPKRLREKMNSAARQPKQTTLDKIPEQPKKETAEPAADSTQEKQITIIGLNTTTKEDDLDVTIGFRLSPSKASFSKITSELHFDGQKLKPVELRIPQSKIAQDEFEFTFALDMRGVPEGEHAIKAEIFELWASEEKLTRISKEVTVTYVPVKREERLVKLPTVKSVAGADLIVVTDAEKRIYRQMEEDMRKESDGSRDEW